MIDDPDYKAELIYGLEIDDLDPYSPEFQQVTDLICLCRLYDRYHLWLLPVEHNALLHAIEEQCTAAGVPFESLQLTPMDEDDWREQLKAQDELSQPCRPGEDQKLDEVTARRIAEHKLIGTGFVLRRGPPICGDKIWRFPARMADEPDVPFDGQSMTVVMCVGPKDRPV